MKPSLAFAVLVAAAVSTCSIGALAEPKKIPKWLSEDQYARLHGVSPRDVKARFAATGVLECPGSRSSGQLTVASDIITTSGHGITDRKIREKWDDDRPPPSVNCDRDVHRLKQCRFSITVNGKRITSNVKSLIATEYKCGMNALRDDWAVLRLENGIDGVRPYGILGGEIPKEANIIAVAAASEKFYGNKNRSIPLKSIENCRMLRAFGINQYDAFSQLDCMSSPGSSGGSILLETSEGDFLVGIIVRSDGAGDTHSTTMNPIMVAALRSATGSTASSSYNIGGITLTAATPDVIQKYQLDLSLKGLIVTDAQGYPKDMLEMLIGSSLLLIEQTPVADTDQVKIIDTILRQKKGTTLNVLVKSKMRGLERVELLLK